MASAWRGEAGPGRRRGLGRLPRRVAALAAAALLAFACGEGGSEESTSGAGEAPASEPAGEATPAGDAAPPPAAESADEGARLVARGERVYRNVCTACHGFDPTRAGSLGPPIAGSSLELLRAKVLRNEYPPGYTPKRDTQAMVPLPHVEQDLPAVAAYLARAADG